MLSDLHCTLLFTLAMGDGMVLRVGRAMVAVLSGHPIEMIPM